MNSRGSVDFTIKTYKGLLEVLKRAEYGFQPFCEFIESPQSRVIVLRHDVDRLPENSLVFARLQNELEIRATYYFRMGPESFHPQIMQEIVSLGHEVGYHYEDVAVEGQRSKVEERPRRHGGHGEGESPEGRSTEERYLSELLERAIESFKRNLERMRQVAPVTTICMHGSPLSKWDNRLLWEQRDYREYGIIGEPYFDVDFNEVLYLTDTGRRWDGERFSVRDRVMSECRNVEDRKVEGRPRRHGGHGEGERPEGLKAEGWKVEGRKAEVGRFPRFHSTFEIIQAVEEGRLPDQMMMTFHPQRWKDRAWPWLWELVWQNVKNGVKKELRIKNYE